jgi:hypothetical protein
MHYSAKVGSMTRHRVMVWLNSQKPVEKQVFKLVNEFKAGNEFSAAFRDGLRLIADLRAGRVDVLLELFPWIPAKLGSGVAPSGDDDLKREIAELKELIQQQSIPGGPLVAAPALKPLTGPKPLGAPKFDLPRFDDDDDGETLVLRKSTSTDGSANFLQAMLGLQQ